MKKNFNSAALSRNGNENRGFSALDSEIHKIFSRLSSMAAKDEKVVKEKAPKGSLSCGMICIYKKESLDGKFTGNKALVAKLVFYPSIVFPDKLESMALYADNALARYSRMITRKVLAGYRVVNVGFGKGLAPYLNVKLVS